MQTPCFPQYPLVALKLIKVFLTSKKLPSLPFLPPTWIQHPESTECPRVSTDCPITVPILPSHELMKNGLCYSLTRFDNGIVETNPVAY